MQSYGGVDSSNQSPIESDDAPIKLPSSTVHRRKTLSARIEQRKELIVKHRRIVDTVCILALAGVALMIIVTDIDIKKQYTKQSTATFVLKSCISVTTFFLLFGICMDYYVTLQIKTFDAGVRDMQTVVTNSTWFCLILEILICAIHPFPGDSEITYTPLHGKDKSMSIDGILSVLMMARLYLVAKFATVHSPLLTDPSISGIGVFSKIKINPMFVFKAAMTNRPGVLLISFMVTTLLVNSWAMRTCELYRDENGIGSYFDAMWLVATTFLTLGYGDWVPINYCGKYIAICTGFMGVASTALLVAVLSKTLEQSRSERYVFNLITRVQIEKRRKHAAADVIKSVIRLWRHHKYSIQVKKLRRKCQDQLKTSLRQLHAAKADKSHVDEFNVGIIEVSETVNRINSSVERLEAKQIQMFHQRSALDSRMTKIERALGDIKALLTVNNP